MKKNDSKEWKTISSSDFSIPDTIYSYKEWEEYKNRNKSFIKKIHSNEELTNEWKIIMTSKYPSDCNYIINEPENNLEF